jgi:uncharacterized protein YciI
MRVVCGTREHARAGRQVEHALLVRGMCGETLRRVREQRIVVAVGQAFDRDGADFAAVRVVVDASAERMREQLMAVADAEHGAAGVDRLREPLRGAFAPSRRSLTIAGEPVTTTPA